MRNAMLNHMKQHHAYDNFASFVTVLKSYVHNITGNQMRDLMKAHYKILGLIDDNDNWINEKFHNIKDSLLPDHMGYRNLIDFIDQIAAIQTKNPYLMHFFHNHNLLFYSKLREHCMLEGDKVIPSAIGYALILENLTTACEKYPDIKKDLYAHINMNPKKFSTEKSMKIQPKKVFLDLFKSSLKEYGHGHKKNAKTGMILAKNYGKTKSNQSNLKPWLELYQSWAMNKNTYMENFPFTLPIYFIPQVANFYEEPEKYFSNLSTAKAIYCHYMKSSSNTSTPINWIDPKFSADWGDSNASMSIAYQSALTTTK